jgi:hypothetical protein
MLCSEKIMVLLICITRGAKLNEKGGISQARLCGKLIGSTGKAWYNPIRARRYACQKSTVINADPVKLETVTDSVAGSYAPPVTRTAFFPSGCGSRITTTPGCLPD